MPYDTMTPEMNNKCNVLLASSSSYQVDDAFRASLPTSFKSSRTPYRKRETLTKQDYIDLDIKVHEYFDKKFYFQPPIHDWQLPPPSQMFLASKWKENHLQSWKKQLNNVKNKLNDFNLDDWHRHTKSMNKAGDIQWTLRNKFEPEFVTQAWCKFYENAMSFCLVPTDSQENDFLCSLHLCEAPGAFITSLNHYLKLNHPDITWQWLATTLNPYYEGNPLSYMINDDRFILQTLDNWNFGLDFTGNLMNIENMLHLVEGAKAKGDVKLVTADGSIDCQEDPGEQETVVAALHYCEAITALHALADGGSFLLKMFTMYECDTVCLMYLLSCAFKKVIINKPATSKEGNSEVYVVCLEYRGVNFMRPWLSLLRSRYGPVMGDKAMFLSEDIPADFLDQLEDCSKQFTEYQIEVIEHNIASYRRRNNDRFITKKLRYLVAHNFMEKYEIRPLDETEEVVGRTKLNATSTLNMDPRTEGGSFNDKVDKRKTAEMEPLRFLEMLEEEVIGMKIEWPYGDDNIKWLKFPVEQIEFHIQTGKPVRTVHSSKFCIGKLLKIRNQVQDLARNEFYYAAFKNESISHDINTTNDNNNSFIDNGSSFSSELRLQYKGATILDFKEALWISMEDGSNGDSEREAFYDIKDIIDEMWRDQTLIIIGYPMLTQFNVGVIYMLGHLFEEVGFVRPNKQDFAVIFKDFRHWDSHMRRFLDRVENTIDKCLKAGGQENVLAVLPVSILCGSTQKGSKYRKPDESTSEIGPQDFYTCVTETNHLCVKEQTMDIISSILRPTVQSPNSLSSNVS